MATPPPPSNKRKAAEPKNGRLDNRRLSPEEHAEEVKKLTKRIGAAMSKRTELSLEKDRCIAYLVQEGYTQAWIESLLVEDTGPAAPAAKSVATAKAVAKDATVGSVESPGLPSAEKGEAAAVQVLPVRTGERWDAIMLEEDDKPVPPVVQTPAEEKVVTPESKPEATTDRSSLQENRSPGSKGLDFMSRLFPQGRL